MGNLVEHFSTNSRLLSEILAKYSDTAIAICELINNSIQANATEIDITIAQTPANEVGRTVFRELIIRDNGIGVSKSDFKSKILKIATKVKNDGKGIGRFSAFQLGSRVEIETVAYDKIIGAYSKSILPIQIDISGDTTLDKLPLNVEYSEIGKENQGIQTYYQVKISEFYEEFVTQKEPYRKITPKLYIENIGEFLFHRYPYLIVNDKIKIKINNLPINPSDYLLEEIITINETVKDLKGNNQSLEFAFMHFHSTRGERKIFLRAENNGIKTVGFEFNFKCNLPDENNWYIYVDSEHFDKKLDSFRNLVLKDANEDDYNIVKCIKSVVDNFFSERYKEYFDFELKLKNDEHYPYKAAKPTSISKEYAFSQISYFVEKEFHILQKKDKIKKLVYPLIDKALVSGDLEALLTAILPLKDDVLKKFKSLLQMSDLNNVICFAEQVAQKNQFLNFLYNIVYNETAAVLRERSQLHKIVEKHLWLFGEEYNGNANLFSDKNLENNLRELREKYFGYELNDKDDNLHEIEDKKIKDITDLFFFYERPYGGQKREVTIVELKAPKCRISDKEINQVKKYRFDIEQKGIFSKTIKYKIILISSHITQFAKSDIGKDRNNPFLLEKSKEHDIEIYIMQWSDIIRFNQEKLSYLGNNLATKDRNTKEYFMTELPNISIQNLVSVLE